MDHLLYEREIEMDGVLVAVDCGHFKRKGKNLL